MAEHLRIRMIPFASPGDIEIKYATKVEGEPATLANWATKVKANIKEDYTFVECELAANTEYPGSEGATKVSGSKAQKFTLNVEQVQEIVEY